RGRLAEGEATVLELAEPFAMTLPAVSKHLKVLERAGLIARRREAQRRPCRLEAAPLRAVADWVEVYRRFWDESFDRLEVPERTPGAGEETWPEAIQASIGRTHRRRPRVRSPASWC